MKVLNRIALFLNIIAVSALLGSYLAPFISPAMSWFVAFLGLSFRVLLFINCGFVVYWFVQLSWNATYSLVGLLAGWWLINDFLQFGTRKMEERDEHSITIIDFNVKAFGAFEGVMYDKSVFFDKLEELKPDIMCFQEFACYKTEVESRMFRALFKKYKDYYKFNVDEFADPPTGYSISVFSRYPIVRSGFVEQLNQGGNCTIFADVVIKGDTVRIVNTHLKSIAFEKQDYKTMEELEENKDETELKWFNFKHIAYKLKHAFHIRAKQAELIKNKLENSPYKIILCGDFNDSPVSYTYNLLRGEMKDAFVESGSGFSNTYHGKMPDYRIDYILCDKSFEIFNYMPHQLNFSDHKMISATIKIR